MSSAERPANSSPRSNDGGGSGDDGGDASCCVICHAADAHMLASACGHKVLCGACAGRLFSRAEDGDNEATCPVCREALPGFGSVVDVRAALGGGDARAWPRDMCRCTFVEPRARAQLLLSCVAAAGKNDASAAADDAFASKECALLALGRFAVHAPEQREVYTSLCVRGCRARVAS